MIAFRVVKKCLSLLDGPARRRWLMLIPLAVLVSGLEALGAVLIFSWIRGVDRAFATAPRPASDPEFFARWVAWLPGLDERTRLVALSGGVAVFFLLKNALRLYEVQLTQRRVQSALVSVSTRLLQAYLTTDYTFHFRRDSASLIRNVHTSVQTAFREVARSAVAGFSEGLVVLAVLLALVALAPAATLATLALLGLVLAVLLRLTQRRFSRWGKRTHELEASIVRSLQQSLGGVKEVKVLGRERFFWTRYAGLRTQLGDLHRHQDTLAALPRLLVETLFVCAMVAVIGLFLLTGSDRGADVLPILGLFAYIGLRVLPSLHLLVYHVNTVRFGAAAVDEIYDDWQALVNGGVESPAPAGVLGFERSIELENVSYSYSSRGNAVEAVTATLAKGESIGVVGATGAGKSTLIDLLLGLLVPTRGQVRVDGRDLHGDPATARAWLANIGYVPQSVYLLDDSLRRNIALGLPDSEIDEAKVRAAVALAQLAEVVSSLPEGLDTAVGERGIRLSGGQRQRVAIARALYRRPEVLIFDEATSALDARTDQELSQAIAPLLRKQTIVIVAHRLSTVRHCDRLFLLQAGRLAAVGTFADLSVRSPEFRRLIAEESGDRF